MAAIDKEISFVFVSCSIFASEEKLTKLFKNTLNRQLTNAFRGPRLSSHQDLRPGKLIICQAEALEPGAVRSR